MSAIVFLCMSWRTLVGDESQPFKRVTITCACSTNSEAIYSRVTVDHF